MSTPSTQRNWRALLIDPFKQIKIGLYAIVITVSFVVALCLLMIRAFWAQYQQIMEIFSVSSVEAQFELVTNRIFLDNALSIGGFVAIFLAFMLVVLVKLTHRYYGPIVAISRFVEAIIEGDYSRRIVLRKGDELQDLALRLNRMAEILEEREKSSSPDSKSS